MQTTITTGMRALRNVVMKTTSLIRGIGHICQLDSYALNDFGANHGIPNAPYLRLAHSHLPPVPRTKVAQGLR